MINFVFGDIIDLFTYISYGEAINNKQID